MACPRFCTPNSTDGDPLLGKGLRQGFTLVEMLMVVFIIAVLGALVMPMVDGHAEKAELVTSRATMQELRASLVGSSSSPGYVADLKHVPGHSFLGTRLHDLLSPVRPDRTPRALLAWDAQARRGWRGPYLAQPTGAMNTNRLSGTSFPGPNDIRFSGDLTFAQRQFFKDEPELVYGRPGNPALPSSDELALGDATVSDAWGNPIVIQTPLAATLTASPATLAARQWHYARLVCAGPDGILQTPADRLAGLLPDGTAPGRGDDLVLFLHRADLSTHETEEP